MLVVVLLGGFTTNAIWCIYLIIRNPSAPELKGEVKGAGADAVVPLGRNYLLCAIGGTAWYLQFFFYTMGESQMGAMASRAGRCTCRASSFSPLSGAWEWKGASRRSLGIMALGLIVLIGATVVIGWGNYKVVHG